MTTAQNRNDKERLADLTEKMGAEPRETKFDDEGHLIKLNLAGLNLTSLPPEIGQFAQLQKLVLGESVRKQGKESKLGNQLSHLPPEIARLTNLQVLRFEYNGLTTLPLEVTLLSNLQRLDLSGNNLTDLPSELTQLTNLKVLGLTGNKLTTLPAPITQLTNLEALFLGYNKLTALPPEISHLANLTGLYLHKNRISTFPLEIVPLTNLQSLTLSGINLTPFPTEIARLSDLRYLNLRKTNLKHFPTVITQLTKLEQLDISNNSLTALPSEIGKLVNLQRFTLHNNSLTVVPTEITQLTNLEHLRIHANPLRTPPPEIVSRGITDILDFMRDLARGSVTRYESKLIIVGEGGIGKSSLLRALRGESFVAGLPTTHGIAVKPYQFPHPDKAQETITLNVWDFGGQQIYHTTHQFFMTQRSLYLLVWNARLDIVQANLDHWLRQIQVLAPKVPVLLVATHVEGRPLDFNYARYKAAYPQLVGSVGVSNRDGTGIEALKAVIAREAAKLELMEQEWPKTWQDAEACLRARGEYHLTQADYADACTAQEVSAEIAKSALGGYLHDLGQILYFQDDDMLADFVVLKPNWLTRAISRVLDDEVVQRDKGVLAHADFARIWDKDENGKPYERHLYPRFLRLMERFLISFRLESDIPNQQATHSLVPLRLPHTPPQMPAWEEVLPDQPAIQMVFRLGNFVPPGLMSWFIVLTHAYTQGLHWREGVRLRYKEHQAQVVLNPSKQELWLRVRGPAPNNFFNILQHTINDRILERFFVGLQYERQVPCNCHTQREGAQACPHFHRYESLVERMEKGKLAIECGVNPWPNVSVPELLYGIHYTTNDKFAAKLDEIHQTVQQGQSKIESKLTQMQIQLSHGFEHLKRDFSRLWNYQMAKLNAECPNTFLIMPGDRSSFNPKNLFNTEYTLYLLCQHPANPHIVRGEEGYRITMAEAWLAKAAPWLKRLTEYLRYIPKGKGIAEAYDEDIWQSIKTSLDVFEAIIEEVPAVEDIERIERLPPSQGRFGEHNVEGAALRALYRFLLEVDEEQHWCGLHKTPTNDGNIFWLCDEHREEHKSV